MERFSDRAQSMKSRQVQTVADQTSGEAATPPASGVKGNTVGKISKRHGGNGSRRGLRRRKTPLKFQVSSIQNATSTTGSTSENEKTAASPIVVLEKRLLMLSLVIRRNKNQHRSQMFFKYLCLLRNSLHRLLAVHKQLSELVFKTSGSGKADEVRKRFEKEANLRGQREVLQEHICEVLVPSCYLVFGAVVGDSQFANLGVVLMALLSEIAAGPNGVGLPAPEVVEDLDTVDARRDGQSKAISRSKDTPEKVDLALRATLLGRSTKMTGEDQGEIIERKYDRDDADFEQGSVTQQDNLDTTNFEDVVKLPRADREEKPQIEFAKVETLTKQQGNYEIVSRHEQSKNENRVDESGRKERRKKKVKGSKNAIDAIFSGFL